MKVSSFRLGVLLSVGGRLVVAFPRGSTPVYPIPQNETSHLTSTIAPSCIPQCEVEYPQLSALQWITESAIAYTTTIVVATVVYEVSASPDATLISTEYNRLPEGYTQQSVGKNSEGVALATVLVIGRDGEKSDYVITYPTPYIDYTSEYSYKGVLPTCDKDSNVICETALPNAQNVPLPSHPIYSQPDAAGRPDPIDPSGLSYIPMWIPIGDKGDTSFFHSAFPSENAFSSCESAPATAVLPTDYTTAKFVTETVTNYVGNYTLISLSRVNSSETEYSSTVKPFTNSPNLVHLESTQTGFEVESTAKAKSGPAGQAGTSPAVAHLESSVSGFSAEPAPKTDSPSQTQVPPQPGASPQQAGPTNVGQPDQGSQNPGSPNQNPAPGTSSPAIDTNPVGAIFTVVPTVLSGQSTTSWLPAFLIPGSAAGLTQTATIGQFITVNGIPTTLAAPSVAYVEILKSTNGAASNEGVYMIGGTSTASVGQRVTVNGQPSVLAVPTPYYTLLTTSINGVATILPAYILPGSGQIATPGQSVTINGQPTVLAVPTAVFTLLTTTINGAVTTIPAYILPGSSQTATIGQTVTINGQPTVLSPPQALFTLIHTTINGKPTEIPEYIISGSSTATIGQTVVINGQTTILSLPSAYFTTLHTTIDGKPTDIPEYIINGTSTATIGQTVVVSGTTTVLSIPTTTSLVPASGVSGAGGVQATGSGGVYTGGVGLSTVSVNGFLLCISAVVFLWL